MFLKKYSILRENAIQINTNHLKNEWVALYAKQKKLYSHNLLTHILVIVLKKDFFVFLKKYRKIPGGNKINTYQKSIVYYI